MSQSPSQSAGTPDLIEAMTTALLVLDQELRIIRMNAACERAFTTSRSRALDQTLTAILPGFRALEARLHAVLVDHTGFIEHELSLWRPAGPPLLIDCTVTPLQASGGTQLLLEILPLERQQQFSRETMLQAQHQASRALVRGLAHEIKNPLGGIRGAAQLLERERHDPTAREYTGIIIREADRLRDLLDRMLGPDRLPNIEQLNVHEALEHVRQLIEAEAPANIRVTRDYDPSLPELRADRTQLIQALLNVARNALQACGEAGEIVLRTRMRRQQTLGAVRHKLAIQIDIEDDGPGIPADIADRIFYPMVSTRSEGTGLGLPIAQYLIHTHDGLIEYHSQPGKTVFSIYLPVTTT